MESDYHQKILDKIDSEGHKLHLWSDTVFISEVVYFFLCNDCGMYNMNNTYQMLAASTACPCKCSFINQN
jgi:hypothetical protein